MATVAPLRPNLQFTDSRGLLTLEAYEFLQNIFLRVGGSLDSLNAVTLADKTWESPNPIGSTTPSSGAFTTLSASVGATVPLLTVSSGVQQGGGLKHVRVTTGSLGASTSALITHTWATPFPNANYTVTASVVGSTGLQVLGVETVSATQVAIRVSNTSAGALTGTLNIIAIHD